MVISNSETKMRSDNTLPENMLTKYCLDDCAVVQGGSTTLVFLLSIPPLFWLKNALNVTIVVVLLSSAEKKV